MMETNMGKAPIGAAALLLGIALMAAACSAGAAQDVHSEIAPASAIEGGAAPEGLAYAQTACVTCHAVLAGEVASPNPDAPAFESIANMPGMTRRALNAWLHSPHQNMPNVAVDPNHIDDLSAYLATLKRPS